LPNTCPRHLEIIYEINQRFLDEVRLKFPRDEEKVRRLSLIDETGDKSVRMANLASVGSHAINGVAALHTELLKQTVLKDFYDLWPEKFVNVTNGVTPRRFLALSNPGLSGLITDKIGPGWVKNLEQLRRLEDFADDPDFQQDWRRVKLANKQALAAIIKERTGVAVNPASLFDIQVKRIHEYKRQHLNVIGDCENCGAHSHNRHHELSLGFGEISANLGYGDSINGLWVCGGDLGELGPGGGGARGPL
jgi:glycogen phosphorylase